MARWEQTDPTPAEIREHCWRIQAGWTDKVRRDRAAWAYEREAVELRQVVCPADWTEAVETMLA